MADTETKKPYDPVESIEPHILAILDPEFVTYWADLMSKAPPAPAQAVTIDMVRANPEKFASACALDTTGYPNTVDKEATSEDGYKIPVRIYYPDKSKHGDGPYPVHLNYHGELWPLMEANRVKLLTRDGRRRFRSWRTEHRIHAVYEHV